MNNSTLGASGEAGGGESQEDEARMKHLKTLIAVVPIVVNITFVIISTSVFLLLRYINAHFNPPQAISSSNANLKSCSHSSFCSYHYFLVTIAIVLFLLHHHATFIHIVQAMRSF